MLSGFDPWVGKISWRRKWQPTQVSFPGKSHGQRSLVGCSPWSHKESGTTERLTLPYLLRNPGPWAKGDRGGFTPVLTGDSDGVGLV